MKKTFFLLTAFTLSFPVFSLPELSDYLKNDVELKKLAIEVKKTELSSTENSIENGISFELSTGTAAFSSDGNDSKITFSPSVSAKVPQLRNLNLSLSSSVKIENGENNSDDTKLSLSADIISGNDLKRRLSLMKAERNLLSARRNLQNRALEAEKEYYTELKSLLESASTIVQNKNSLYEDSIDFEEIKAKGYAEASSKYRQAELKVRTDEHNVETQTLKLKHDCAVFASKCGTSFNSDEPLENFFPTEITKVEAVNAKAFSKENFTKIEEAEYTHKYNSLERQADKNFTLSVNTGCTIKNSNSSDSDTIDAGISTGISGITLGAGISVPVASDSKNPVYTLSASINPNEIKTRRITEQTYNLTDEQENLSIQQAEEDYDTQIVDQENSLSDINWSKLTNQQNYEMYSNLEKDLSEYLKEGLISESEYLSAYENKELYRLKLLVNDIELIIYNDETTLLFCRDEQFQE